jgi:hypothetical protein
MPTQMEGDCTFEEAVRMFREFVSTHGYPSEIIWLWPDDVIVAADGIILVRMPVPPENGARVQRAFEEGMRRGRGVLLSTLCGMAEQTCCYIWVPRNEQDAMEHLMPPGVKFSLLTESSRRQGVAVTNRFRWVWMKLRYRRQQAAKDEFFQ